MPKRFLCLLMAGLTACTTTHPTRAWREMPTLPTGAAKPVQMLDHWGEPSSAWNATDPVVAPGFLLTMFCAADSKLNGDFRVDFKGNLQLPYDMTVVSSGMTLSQLKTKLIDVYRPYFKSVPEIDLHLKERRYWLDVRGLVEKPGRYLVEPEASLDQAIGLAGGTSKEATPLYLRIQKESSMFVFDLAQYYSRGDEDHQKIIGWVGGEVLFFQKEMGGMPAELALTAAYRQPVYFMGEVRKPGEYLLNPGSDYLDSLMQTGGFTEKADLDNIEIVRRSSSGRKRMYTFTWDQFQHAPPPEQGDLVFVHADNTTKFERHTTLLAVIIGALASVATAVVIVLAYNKGRV